MIKLIIFAGGGGVGKSFLIRVVSKWIERILRAAGDHPEHPKCLLIGPTGISAALIGKSYVINKICD